MQDSFWNYSLRVYALPGVADACLRLQDQHGADVNMILYCCWHGATYGPLENAALARAVRFSSAWSKAVVRPLRAARRSAKKGSATRRLVAALELAAECLEQRLLELLTRAQSTQANGERDAGQAAGENLAGYCRTIGMDVRAASAELAVILEAAFPGTGPGNLLQSSPPLPSEP